MAARALSTPSPSGGLPPSPYSPPFPKGGDNPGRGMDPVWEHSEPTPFTPDPRPTEGSSIGSDLVNGLKGLFTLPKDFRKYSR